jgi:hypothetical protein
LRISTAGRAFLSFKATRTFAERAINLLICTDIDVVGISFIHLRVASADRALAAPETAIAIAKGTGNFLIVSQIDAVSEMLLDFAVAIANGTIGSFMSPRSFA